MQTFVQTFAGVTTWQLNVAGSYFVTLQCTNPINVRLYRGGKKLDLGDMAGLMAGLEIGPLPPLDGFPFAFDRIEIDVTGADTIKVGIGNGQARYNRANGTVDINSFPAGSANVLINAAQVLQLIRPEQSTGFYAANSLMAANTPDTVFTPAANANGAIILYASLFSNSGATPFGASMIAKASAPATVIDGEIIIGGRSQGGNVTVGDLQMPTYLAAGKGLYFISTTVETVSLRSCRYKLL